MLHKYDGFETSGRQQCVVDKEECTEKYTEDCEVGIGLRNGLSSTSDRKIVTSEKR